VSGFLDSTPALIFAICPNLDAHSPALRAVPFETMLTLK
jgi:hypothetical protein